MWWMLGWVNSKPSFWARVIPVLISLPACFPHHHHLGLPALFSSTAPASSPNGAGSKDGANSPALMPWGPAYPYHQSQLYDFFPGKIQDWFSWTLQLGWSKTSSPNCYRWQGLVFVSRESISPSPMTAYVGLLTVGDLWLISAHPYTVEIMHS